MTQKLAFLTMMVLIAVYMLGSIFAVAQSSRQVAPARPALLTDQLEIQFESDVDVNRIVPKSTGLRTNIPTLDRVMEKYKISQAKKMFPWRKGKDAMAGTDDMSKFHVISMPKGSDVYAIIDELQKNPYVRSVSPVYAMPLYEVIPDDPKFGVQWGLNTIGAKDAWEIEKGSEEAIVAIVDVGVLYTHPDLVNNIWVNPGEDLDNDGVVFDLDDINGADDDGNGLIDDFIGYDFFTGVSSSSPWPGEDVTVPDNDPKDFNGHGTHCAGIASAAANNAAYGAGLAGGWGGGIGPYRGSRIMCIRVGGSYEHPDDPLVETGFVNTTNCAQGVDYAATMGACVINCSWAFSVTTQAMASACLKCNNNGVVVVHAAGNEDEYSPFGGFLDDLYLGTPSQQVALSVAATSPGDFRANFSNYGEYIDVCAPGDNIYSTYSNHYGPSDAFVSGTSMAAPMVAGLAALIKSHMPEYTKVEINDLIINSAVNIDALNSGYEGWLGAGRIDASAALADLPTAAFSAGPELLGPIPLEVDFTDLSPNSPTYWEWDFGDGGSSYIQNPVHIYNSPGMYSVSLTVDEPKGTATDVLRNLVAVTADTMKFGIARIPTSASGQHVIFPVNWHNQFLGKQMSFSYQIKKDGANVSYYSINPISYSTVGCRTEYFESVDYAVFDHTNSRYKIWMASDISGGSRYMQPGEGTVLNFDFFISGSVTSGSVFTFDTLTMSGPPVQYVTPFAEYYPEFLGGYIYVTDDLCGDVNGDGALNILDIVFLLMYKYKGGPAPVPVQAADVNLDGIINLQDIIDLINFKYKGGPEPCSS